MIPNLTPYPEYQQTGLPWLGLVPGHWDVRPAFGVFTPNHVRNHGMKEKTVLSLSYGHIIIKPEEKLHGLVPESFETYQIVNPGDIVLRTTDLQNDHTSLRVGMVRNRGIITSAYLALRANAGVNPEFGFQFLNVWDMTKAIYGYGSGLRQNLDFSHFKRMPIPLPPPEEQAAIVWYLDYMDRRIRRYIRAKEKLIKLLEEQKQAIIHHAVTRGLDPNVPLKPSGIEWLGDIPEHWEVLALKRVLRMLVDCEHKTAPGTENSPYFVVRTSAVRNGRLQMSGTYCTTEAGFGQWTQRALPEAGDVIFTREAPVGEACIIPPKLKVCLGQRTVLMKLKEGYDAQYLVYMVYAGPPSFRIKLASQGSTVGHFNMDDIGWMHVLRPPYEEQRRIVDEISRQVEPTDRTISEAQRQIALLREYRTRLIADVVTGNVDVRGVPVEEIPEDEALDTLPPEEDDLGEEHDMDESLMHEEAQ